ncbi:hypothetical protein [Sabulibacter ruber]|uniref:hypothetical protein n=1 Tax=Sabulibacter ruber TaxID=2811901 RepID=UPI001A96B92C|nr:hypothetical protein [Sabulibacter ruber]
MNDGLSCTWTSSPAKRAILSLYRHWKLCAENHKVKVEYINSTYPCYRLPQCSFSGKLLDQMKHSIHLCLFPLLIALISGCGLLRKSAKDEFVDGYYRQRFTGKKQLVYVNVDENKVLVYPVHSKETSPEPDTANVLAFYSEENHSKALPVSIFSKKSLDLDFLTTPLKYRFPTAGIPRQLNSNLNGSIYVGMRTDRYVLHYHSTPLRKAERSITHLGFSAGLFSGLGNTAINPTTTQDQVNQEYDGIIWSKGIAGIVAINNFTAGLALGFDNLLDTNRRYWAYQYKPWIGLSFGLNLN